MAKRKAKKTARRKGGTQFLRIELQDRFKGAPFTSTPAMDLSKLAPHKDGGARPVEGIIQVPPNLYPPPDILEAVRRQPAYLVRLRGGPHDGMVLGIKILRLPSGEKIMQPVEVMDPPDDLRREAAPADLPGEP